jgi:hypothetical protein
MPLLIRVGDGWSAANFCRDRGAHYALRMTSAVRRSMLRHPVQMERIVSCDTLMSALIIYDGWYRLRFV